MKSQANPILEKSQKMTEKGFSFSQALASFMEGLSPRTRDIISARFALGGGSVKTLEEIGSTYGITRERIRQILGSAFSAVRHQREHPLFKEAVATIETVLRSHSGIISYEELFTLVAGESKKEQGAVTFFLECFRSIRMVKETPVRRRVFVLADFSLEAWDDVQAAVEKIFAGADHALTEAELFKRAQKMGVKIEKKVFFDYLAVSASVRKNSFGRFGLAHSSEISPRGTREKAYLILKMHGSPLHFKDIATRIDKSGLQKKGKITHPQTVHNELIKDKKFVLIGRGLYALAEWGYARGTVREVLKTILEQHRAPMAREDIVAAVANMRQVKRSTVIINLNTFFEKVGKDEYTVKR